MHDRARSLPFLIHGDAAFPGQGVVAETLNLQALDGLQHRRHLHLIANNQLGFTTDPGEARSTRYASDLAKGFEIPIIHVNADDPEACIAAVRLAHAYRRTFGTRRADRPGRLPPLRPQRGRRARLHAAPMYERDQAAPARARALRREARGEGVVSPRRPSSDRAARPTSARARRTAAEGAMAESAGDRQHGARPHRSRRAAHDACRPTSCARSTAAAARARGLHVHPQARAAPRAPRAARSSADGRSTGRHAETLAFASLLARRRADPAHRPGHRARHLQPAPRGAARRRERRALRAAAGPAAAPTRSFELYNSPLSESACLGFEYGYSVPGAGRAGALGGPVRRLRQRRPGHRRPVHRLRPAKWGQTSRLVLLLPHGYEGRARALQRAAGALPAAGRRGQHPRRQLHHAGAVLPPAAPPGAALEGRAR